MSTPEAPLPNVAWLANVPEPEQPCRVIPGLADGGEACLILTPDTPLPKLYRVSGVPGVVLLKPLPGVPGVPGVGPSLLIFFVVELQE